MDRAQPSRRAKDALVDELRDAVGDDAVDRTDLDLERHRAGAPELVAADGSRYPEGALNDLVAQTAEQEDEQEAGRTKAEDIKRQQESWTPDSPTRRSRPL